MAVRQVALLSELGQLGLQRIGLLFLLFKFLDFAVLRIDLPLQIGDPFGERILFFGAANFRLQFSDALAEVSHLRHRFR